MLAAKTKPVANADSKSRSAPAQAPIAAEPHSVAAVFRPRTLPSSRMMTPAEKPDPGYHIPDHVNGALVAIQSVGHVHEHRRAHGHEHIGAQAGRPLPVLALNPISPPKINAAARLTSVS